MSTSPTDELLAMRGTTHGDFAVHADVTQRIKRTILHSWCGPEPSDMQREALDMIAHKIGRIVAGDANHKDHWDDIAGYAILISQRLSTSPVPQVNLAQSPEPPLPTRVYSIDGRSH